MKTSVFVLLLVALTAVSAVAQTIPPDSLYFGQTPPGNTPQIFAPGIISVSGRVEYGISISPSGDEMLFSLGSWPDKRTMIVKYENNHWIPPDTVSFSTTRSAEEAIYSPDGSRVYYYAYSPPNPVGGADLCYSVKSGTAWSEPVNLGAPLNTSQDEYHPCIVADSSVYFENVSGKICYSHYQNGAYLPRILMPALFNDPGMAWGNPYVSPDESYFIFNSARPGGFGGTDLYISYKKTNGTWTNPKNLGNSINTATQECGAEITDDSLYMTYVSNNDIYWVGSGFIDSLRYTNFIPYVLNPIPAQTAITGINFAFMVPDTTFVDDDGNQTLTYGAVLSNGSPLPSWLSLDTLSATFSGIPPVPGVLNIRVTATDTAGASASAGFKLTITYPVSMDDTTASGHGVKVFPDPTTGMIRLSLSPAPEKPVIAEVYSLQGVRVATEPFRQDLCLDLSGCPKGPYLVMLRTDDRILVRKMVIR